VDENDRLLAEVWLEAVSGPCSILAEAVEDPPKPGEWARYVYRRWVASVRPRGLEVGLSLELWWAIWAPYCRVRERASLCIARKRDIGGYIYGNVYITTRGQNARDWGIFRRERAVGQLSAT
jgi:hypothetical protein